MDFMKMLKAATLPIGIMIAMVIAADVLTLIPVIGLVGVGLSGLAFFVLNPILLGWSGFKAAKEMGADLTGSAITGALAGLVVSIVSTIIGLVFSLIGGAVVGASSGAAGAGIVAGIGLIGTIIGAVVLIPVFVVGGAVCGAIGGYAATNMGKSAPAKK